MCILKSRLNWLNGLMIDYQKLQVSIHGFSTWRKHLESKRYSICKCSKSTFILTAKIQTVLFKKIPELVSIFPPKQKFLYYTDLFFSDVQCSQKSAKNQNARRQRMARLLFQTPGGASSKNSTKTKETKFRWFFQWIWWLGHKWFRDWVSNKILHFAVRWRYLLFTLASGAAAPSPLCLKSLFFAIFSMFYLKQQKFKLNQPKVESTADKKCGTLHDFACHPCAGAMLIFSVSFQF